MNLVSCDDLSDYVEEIGDGYYFEPEHKEICYDVEKVSCGVFYQPVISDITSFKNLPDYILIMQKLDYPNSYRYDLSFNDKFKDKTYCSIAEASTVYPYGLNNTYYFILEKETHKLFGPFIYKEFLEECNERSIEIF